MNAWKKFCESLKDSTPIENIPANELDLPLSKFFILVRKQNHQHLWSDSEKCLLSWIVGQVHRLIPKRTKWVPPLQHNKMSSQSNKSSLRQFLSERIVTSSKAAHLTSTFSVVISRGSQGWMRTDHWAIEAQTGITYTAIALLVTFHKLLFQPQAFSLSLYETFCLHSLTKFIQSWTLNVYFCPVYVFVPLLSCLAI